EGADGAVAAIAHQQHGVVVRGSDRGESSRRNRQAPGRIELAARDQAHLAAGQSRRAVEVEYVHETVALASHVVVLGGVLLGIADVDLAVQKLDVEGGETVRELRIGKRAGG